VESNKLYHSLIFGGTNSDPTKMKKQKNGSSSDAKNSKKFELIKFDQSKFL